MTWRLQNGAADRDRTCDIKFGKLALYQLRYYRKMVDHIGVEPITS